MESTLRLFFALVFYLTTVNLTFLLPYNDTSTSKGGCLSSLSSCYDNISQSEKSNCQCDALCWQRKDCCFDYFNSSLILNETVPSRILNAGHKYQCVDFVTSIEYPTLQIRQRAREKGYSLISKCGGSWDEETSEISYWQRKYCEQPDEFEEDHLLRIPVSNNVTGNSYKNIYCAACHKDTDDLIFWKTNVVCAIKSPITNLSESMQLLNNQTDCQLQILPPDNFNAITCRTGIKSTTGECSPDYVGSSTSEETLSKRREIEWLCRVTIAPILVNKTYYLNPYCAACHLDETDVEAVFNLKHGSCVPDLSPFCHICLPVGKLASKMKSFALLMDVDFSSSKGNVVGLLEKCPVGEIYDVFSQRCRLIFCSTGYRYESGKCELIATTETSANFVNPDVNRIQTSVVSKVIKKCPKMRVDAENGKINEDGSLTVTLKENRTYLKEEYELDNDSNFFVCIDLSDNYVFQYSSQMYIYLTIFCSSVSLICLFLKIITYIFITETRNFPAKLVFCLSISLFFAQLLFLTTTSFIDIYPLCAAIAVFTHYFFLAAFCWMNILAYDLWRTFSTCIQSRTLSQSGSVNRRFHCYSLYAWITPFSIVSLACLFDWGNIVDEYSLLRPNYGEVACWISSKSALLFYFVAPFAVILLVNVFLFFMTSTNIWVSSKATSFAQSNINSQQKSKFGTGGAKLSVNKSPHHLRFSLYVKLALIMGLTWFTGFIAPFSGVTFLWYIFIATNASQGVYILLAFTPFRKVQRYVQMKFRPKSKSGFKRHPFFTDDQSSHKKLHRSSTRSSQTTTVSINYSSQGHQKATVAVSNPL